MKYKNRDANDDQNLLELLKAAAKQNNLLAVRGKLEGDPLAMGLYEVNGKLVWLRLKMVEAEKENQDEAEIN